jgi:hypothetical protein
MSGDTPIREISLLLAWQQIVGEEIGSSLENSIA